MSEQKNKEKIKTDKERHGKKKKRKEHFELSSYLYNM